MGTMFWFDTLTGFGFDGSKMDAVNLSYCLQYLSFLFLKCWYRYLFI